MTSEGHITAEYKPNKWGRPHHHSSMGERVRTTSYGEVITAPLAVELIFVMDFVGASGPTEAQEWIELVVRPVAGDHIAVHEDDLVLRVERCIIRRQWVTCWCSVETPPITVQRLFDIFGRKR